MKIIENNAVTCKKGWVKLYQPIIDTIVEHDLKKDRNEDKIGIKDIGSKDGKMYVIPIHFNAITKEIGNLIKENVEESSKVCEFCGNTYHVGMTMNNTIVTCCYDCWKDEILSKFSNSIFKEQ